MDMSELTRTLWPWSAFLVSLAIGLLLGLERERAPSAKAGLRTFSLVALAGTIGALLSDRTGAPWMLAAGLLALAGMMVAAYWRAPDESDPGTTTVAAVVVCYGLGAMVWYGYVDLAVALAILSTILLYFKTELRQVSQRLTRRDLVSILQFAVLSLVILPILPNQSFGPYNALNPYHIWWMVVLVSGLSLAGYAALRMTGQRHGAILTGLFGGVASSTATTLAFSRHTREQPAIAQLATFVILTANLVVLVRLTLIVALISPRLLGEMALMISGGLLFGLLTLAWLWRHLYTRAGLPQLEISNPAEIHAAVGFGALYAAVLFASAWLSDLVGSSGVLGVALISGLTDVDAITLSSLRLFDLDSLSAHNALTAILLAIFSNTLFKGALAAFLGGWPLARQVLPGFIIVLLGIAGSYAGFLS